MLDIQIQNQEENIKKLNRFITELNKFSNDQIIAKGLEGKQAFLNYSDNIDYVVEYDIITEFILQNKNANILSDFIIQNYTLRQGLQKCIDFLNRRIAECENILNVLKAKKNGN